MVQGMTTTSSLADSLPTVLDAARIIREYDGVFMRTCETQKLPEGTGLSWDEISLAQLSAQAITETTVLENPQMIQDDLFSISPTVVGIQTRITDRGKIRITPQVAAKLGQLGQNAITRFKDETYLTVLDGATTSLCGAGATFGSGYVGAAVSRIKGNTTEPGTGVINTVLHSFQIKDIQDELVAGVGTYTVPTGMTEEIFRRGFMGTVLGSNVFDDGNIVINGSSDAKGGTHTKEAIVLVQGRSPWAKTVRQEHIGGGAEDMFHYDEYALGERSVGNWLYEQYSNATAPTS